MYQAEAPWNQNTHKSRLLEKMLPRSINTFEVAIEMSEVSITPSASVGRQLSDFRFRELADVSWQTYVW